MHYIQQIGFVALAAIATWVFTKKIGEIRRNILLGKDEDLNDQPAKRWKNLLLLALGQKKMFKNPLVAVMHLVIYLGFVIICFWCDNNKRKFYRISNSNNDSYCGGF